MTSNVANACRGEEKSTIYTSTTVEREMRDVNLEKFAFCRRKNFADVKKKKKDVHTWH